MLLVLMRTQLGLVARRLFSRREIRTTLIAAGLAGFAPLALAADLSDLSGATDIISLIEGYISGPWLFGIGVVLIILGSVAISSSEGTIGKLLSTCLVGLGLASAVVPIAQNHLHLVNSCA
ncbi:conjugal transfer protein TrbC [Paraburkholderia humisilvae]|nr:conjugal transfer protein TrbC [Paraburkholderia humisilvae]